jgi:hypothetical protein
MMVMNLYTQTYIIVDFQVCNDFTFAKRQLNLEIRKQWNVRASKL